MPVTRQAYLTGLGLAALVSLIWASSFFLIKAGIRATDPLTFAGYRYLLGGLILAAFVFARRRAGAVAPRAWRYALGCAVLCYLVGQGFLYVAQAAVPPLAGAFFYSLAPAFVLVITTVLWRRVPTRWQLAGLGIIVAGSLLFVRTTTVAAIPPGALAEFIASNLGTAGYLLLVRRALDDGVSGLWLTWTSLVIGGAALLVAAASSGRSLALAPSSTIPLLWLALINTALAYALYVKALSVIQPFEVSVVTALIPLEAAAMAWLAFGQAIDAVQLAGLVIATGGIIAVQLRAFATLRPG